ncbi:MAG: hypothetical protein M1818_004041 [Claussenomyces sp. TS43310]|nr:MAG: hypothetical protein M1818_004041 [Claussenomyces sp. TS43310]
MRSDPVKQILIPSTRNPVGAQLTLFQRANTKSIIYASSISDGLQDLFSATKHMKRFQVPELETFFHSGDVPHYCTKARESGEAEIPFAVCHTSGSSGNPKPITWTKDFILNSDSAHSLPTDQGPSATMVLCKDQRVLSLLPLFHAGGFSLSLYPALYDSTIVLGHPDVPVTADYVIRLLTTDNITAMLAPPSILEDMTKIAGAIDRLARLEHVAYGGGPLHAQVGSVLAPRLKHLFSYIGATEYGWFHLATGGSDRWDCLRFFDNVGYHFEVVSEQMFELVIVKNAATDHFHGIFETFPTINRYRTKDLYSPVAEHPGWMRYQGRTDDLIVLSKGEKINPIPMENIVRSHEMIRDALIVGDYRADASLLLELVDSETLSRTQKADLIDRVWPIIQEANKLAPGFARIRRPFILFTTPSKPFQRAAKGTVQRQLSVQSYAKELEELYSTARRQPPPKL